MKEHDSDCAVHNGPAYPAGYCDCSQKNKYQELIDGLKSEFPVQQVNSCSITFDTQPGVEIEINFMLDGNEYFDVVVASTLDVAIATLRERIEADSNEQ